MGILAIAETAFPVFGAYKWAIIAGSIVLAISGSFCYGYAKGETEERKTMALAAEKLLLQERLAAVKTNKELSAELFAGQARQEELAKAYAANKDQLKAALSKHPQFIQKQCDVGQDIADLINGKAAKGATK